MPVRLKVLETKTGASLLRKEGSMILKCYSIYDAKGEIFNPPFYKRTHGEGERTFTEICHDEKSAAWKFPEDFDLYYCGEYDDQTGKYEPLNSPQHMMKAVQVRKRDS